MSVTELRTARTFRLPNTIETPEDIPNQHTLAAEPSMADELAAYEQLEMWDQLAGIFLRRGASSRTVRCRRQWQERAETVAVVAADLAEAVWQATKDRHGL